mmetsp:Transcript_14117/g.26131  ORF Transcript_14117/g.26131 Transcript_14117/m.26131 type:complete len:215 (-) Transcript_14117:125-769(-)
MQIKSSYWIAAAPRLRSAVDMSKLATLRFFDARPFNPLAKIDFFSCFSLDFWPNAAPRSSVARFMQASASSTQGVPENVRHHVLQAENTLNWHEEGNWSVGRANTRSKHRLTRVRKRSMCKRAIGRSFTKSSKIETATSEKVLSSLVALLESAPSIRSIQGAKRSSKNTFGCPYSIARARQASNPQNTTVGLITLICCMDVFARLDPILLSATK